MSERIATFATLASTSWTDAGCDPGIRQRVRAYLNSHLKEEWVPLKHSCMGPDFMAWDKTMGYPRTESFHDLTHYMEHLSEWHHKTTGSDENIIKLLEEYTE